MSSKKAKKHSFVRGMFSYAIIFILVSAVVLTVFWGFLSCYELSRPEIALEQYEETLNSQEHIDALASLYLDSSDFPEDEIEDMRAAILKCASDGISLRKNISESDDEHETYMLICGKNTIGSMELAKGDELAFGFSRWKFGGETADFSFIEKSSVSVTVPEDASLYDGDTLLDESFITESGIEYPAYEKYYDDKDYDFDLPYLVTYTLDYWEIEPELKCIASDGEELDLSTDLTDVAPKLMDDDTHNEIEEFADNFIQKYYKFSASARGSAEENFDELSPYIDPASTLMERLSETIEFMDSYAQNRGGSLNDIRVNAVMPLDDGSYFCDVSYEANVKGLHGESTDVTTSMRLIIIESGNSYLVTELTNY